MKERLDIELYNRGLVRSRTSARELINRKSVVVNKVLATKANQKVSTEDIIEITSPLPYVSRGGEKLAHALKVFNIKPSGLICLDIGSSTGGFTDCLLQNGASKVYAVDVGTEQLDSFLRTDKRVITHEKTDIREVRLPELVDIIVVDLSFISLTKILKQTQTLLKPGHPLIALVKPQFELEREILNRNGIVKEKADRERALNTVIDHASEIGFTFCGYTQSPIEGGDGNIEFLIHLKNNG